MAAHVSALKVPMSKCASQVTKLTPLTPEVISRQATMNAPRPA